MPLIKLSKTNEAGEAAGTILVNPDHIVAVTIHQSTTEVQMSDGRARWVKETPEEVAKLVVKAAP
jgi:uncharacterized protein YlzI (FlbEa/FlbD family)